MKCVVVLLIAAQAIICSGTVSPAYNPVFEYDVPVASQPLVYAPAAHHTPYGSYGSYAVHTTPAVSHSFSQTQTHPVAYVKPVTVFGGGSSYYAPAYGQAYGQPTVGHYYQPAAATSRVQSTRLIIPQTSRLFRYQAPSQQYNSAPQSGDRQFDNQGSNRNVQGRRRFEPQNSQAGPAQYQDQYNGNGQDQYDQNSQGQNNRGVYAGGMPYTNNGEQVKLRRYRIHRPGIKKEFYDVEERTIIRPAGSALIELDPPTKKQDITDYQPYGRNNDFNQGQFNSQKGNRPNNQGGGNNQGGVKGRNNNNGQDQGPYLWAFPQSFGQRPNNQGGSQNDDRQYFIVGDQPDCGDGGSGGSGGSGGYDGFGGPGGQIPVNEYGPPATNFGNNQPPQYHPTTFAPPTNNYPTTVYQSTPSYPSTTASYPTSPSYPTTVTIPNQTYLPPYGLTDQSVRSSTGGDYPQSSTSSSTPGQYTPQSTTGGSTSTGGSSTTSPQSDIYISSTTPVTITIVDKNGNGTESRRTPSQGRDIIYAGQGQRGQGRQGSQFTQNGQNGQSDDDQPDQFQNELPPRGDLSQYRAEQPDQFYHELPRGRYTNEPSRPPQAYNVQTRSRGEPTDGQQAEVVEIDRMRNRTNARNRTSNGNKQQARLIELYTGNGGVSEVGQTEDQADSRYPSNGNGNRNSQYQDAGKVRARIVSVTPPPATAIPQETVNRRRIVVSKPVTTVQEVVEADNSTGNGQKGNYRANYSDGNRRDQGNRNYNNADNRYRNSFESEEYNGDSGDNRNVNNGNGQRGNYRANYADGNPRDQNRNYNNGENRYQNSFESEEYNGDSGDNRNVNDNNDNYSSEFNGNYRSGEYNNADSQENSRENSQENFNDENNDRNYNGDSRSQSKKANYEDESKAATPSGVFISTTPSTASQRIIYVQPVSQDFAQQKAVTPKTQKT